MSPVRLPYDIENGMPAEGCRWFLNSFKAIHSEGWSRAEKIYDEVYEKTYGVKLIFADCWLGEPEDFGSVKFRMLMQVEFPNEDEAAMFLLRWA